MVPGPDHIPMFPYLTLKAEADSPRGPWRKRYDITPWKPMRPVETASATCAGASAWPGWTCR